MDRSDPTHGSYTFEWVCKQPDPEAVVAGLDDDGLRSLHAFLIHLPETGIPGLIRGLTECEASRRFLSPQAP